MVASLPQEESAAVLLVIDKAPSPQRFGDPCGTSLQIFVKADRTYAMRARRSMGVSALKQRLSEHFKLQQSRIWLMCGSKPMAAGTLRDYDVCENTTLHMHVRLCGGMEHLENGTKPLLDSGVTRSDARTEADRVTRPVLVALLGTFLLAGVSHSFGVTQRVVHTAAQVRAGFLDYALANPVGFLLLLLSLLTSSAAVLWYGSWVVAEHTDWLVRKPATQRGWFHKASDYALGLFSLGMYVLDVWSDVLVAVLLWSTRNYIWATEATFLLVLQYVLVYWRVCEWWGRLERYRRDEEGEYLNAEGRRIARYEREKLAFTTSERWAWAPGVFGLDGLMLAQPFGVMRLFSDRRNQAQEPVGWSSTWRHRLESFLPTYKATRVIVEVVTESMPQSLLQAYIFVRVMGATGDLQPAAHTAILEEASILPISISISALNLLKVWAELLYGARTAKVPMLASLLQIWEMGAGKLPLDAIRRNTIDKLEWHSALPNDEWNMLVDAFLQNESLVTVDLSRCELSDAHLHTLAGICARGALPLCKTFNLLNNNFGMDAAHKLIKAVEKRESISFCGKRFEASQTNFAGDRLQDVDAVLIAASISSIGDAKGSLAQLKVRLLSNAGILAAETWHAVSLWAEVLLCGVILPFADAGPRRQPDQ